MDALSLLAAVLGAAASLVLGGVIPLIERLLNRYDDSAVAKYLEQHGYFERDDADTYQAKIHKALALLAKATADVDAVVRGITDLAQERQQNIAKLETQLAALTTRESEVKAKIAALEQVPLPAMKYFEEALRTGDKRSAYRDYALFGAGVLVSTIVTLVLKRLGF